MVKKNYITSCLLILALAGLTSCSSVSSKKTPSSGMRYQESASLNNSYHINWQNNPHAVWSQLQLLSVPKLFALKNRVADPSEAAWIQLAIISKQKNMSTSILVNALLDWREQYPDHPGNALLPPQNVLLQLQSEKPPQHLAILLPQNGLYGSSGQTVRAGFLNAYYANLPKIGNQTIKFYDTTQASSMKALYQQAIADGADLVIGPLVKNNVDQLSGASSFSVPTIALNYSGEDTRLPPQFYQYGLAPEDEAKQIANHAFETGHLHALLIAPDTPWGKHLAASLRTRWQNLGGTVTDDLFYGANTTLNQDIAHLLQVRQPPNEEKIANASPIDIQHRQDFDVIFMLSRPQEAGVIVSLLRYFHADNVPIYTTSSIYASKLSPAMATDLKGVLVCDIPWKKQGTAQHDVQSGRLYAVGKDAYLLSQSLPRLTDLPNFPLYGTTGALTISQDHIIHRRTPCVGIDNGIV